MIFPTREACKAYIDEHHLIAIPMGQYSEETGELLGYTVYYI